MHWRKLCVVVVIIPLLGVGCTDLLVTNARDAAEWAGKEGSRLIQESGTGYVRNLTQEQKAAIDEWLVANSLNEYGDKLGTFYTGGTPLFNEATGETIDRFKYLFEKFPELKDVISDQLQKQSAQ